MPSFKREGGPSTSSLQPTPHAEIKLEKPQDTSKPSCLTSPAFFHSPLAQISKDLENQKAKALEMEIVRRLTEMEGKLHADSNSRGYQEGLEKGKAEAYAARAGEVDAQIKRFGEILELFEGAKERIFQENEKILIRMVHEIAKRVVLHEVQIDPEYLKRLLVDVVASVGVRDAIRISIRPEDKATIENLASHLSAKLPELKNVTIESSEDVREIGLVLESDLETIDAKISTQLESMKEAIDRLSLSKEK